MPGRKDNNGFRAAGAAPKPHTILDKSLKADEFKTADVDPKVVQALAGLVPYRPEPDNHRLRVKLLIWI